MKILFATDGSPCSDFALREACRLLPVEGAQAMVLAVLDVGGYVGAFEAYGVIANRAVERADRTLAMELAQARAVLEAHGAEVSALELDGSPAATILETAEQFRPDVIVLGSHGRGALGRLALGSVSDRVLHAWPGAVLVIRPASEEP